MARLQIGRDCLIDRVRPAVCLDEFVEIGRAGIDESLLADFTNPFREVGIRYHRSAEGFVETPVFG